MYGFAQASIVPEPSAGWAWSHCLPREGSWSLLSLLAGLQWISHTHVVLRESVFATYLSFREAKPRVSEYRCLYTGVWSCPEGTASEESGKESCVIEPAIEGSIEGGSIAQHWGKTVWLFCRVFLHGITERFVSYPGDFVLEEWKHITVVFNGTRVKGYSDGVLNSDRGVDMNYSPKALGNGVLMVGRLYTGGYAGGDVCGNVESRDM